MISCKKGLTLATQLLSGKFPIIPVVNFIQPVGLGWTINHTSNKLTIPLNFNLVDSQKPIFEVTKQYQQLNITSKSKFAIEQKPVSQPQKKQPQQTITTKFKFAKYHKPEPQTQKKQPQLTLTAKFRFANYQKPTAQPLKKQQPFQQKPATTSATNTNSPSTTQQQQSSQSKPLYTARDMFVIMMSSIGLFMWGQILLKQYYKKQPPTLSTPPVIIQKVVQKPQAKSQQQQQSLGLVFMLFLMCVFIIAAEFWRMRNFDKIYQELRTVHRVLKDEVHGIQLQLIRERLGAL